MVALVGIQTAAGYCEAPATVFLIASLLRSTGVMDDSPQDWPMGSLSSLPASYLRLVMGLLKPGLGNFTPSWTVFRKTETVRLAEAE